MRLYGSRHHRRLAIGVLLCGLMMPGWTLAQTPAAATAPPASTAPQTSAPQSSPAPSASQSPPATQAQPATAASRAASQPAAPTQASPAAPAIAPAEAQAVPSPAPASQNPDVMLKLPRDLSPWGMFMAADIVVKAVMVGLAFASVLTWTIWLAKALELMAGRLRMQRAIEALEQARAWSEASERLGKRRDSVGALVNAADTELKLSANGLTAEGAKERIVSRLERIEAAAGRQMIRGMGILATIGATAPFVGLFGTVWGIMNSFIGISKAQTTNLAVVAPGIAEALLATALGLVAAIPAVVMYNMFSRWTAGYRAQHADASAAILRLISRDFDGGAFTYRPAERRTSAAAE